MNFKFMRSASVMSFSLPSLLPTRLAMSQSCSLNLAESTSAMKSSIRLAALFILKITRFKSNAFSASKNWQILLRQTNAHAFFMKSFISFSRSEWMDKTCASSRRFASLSMGVSLRRLMDRDNLSVSPLASSNLSLYKFQSSFLLACSSFSFFSWSSRERSEQAQQLPCPFQILRQIQQNQYLHLQVICMQPLFFSMISRHMGHFCTTSPLIHWSSRPFIISFQLRRSRQFNGQCPSAPQCRQTSVPQAQTTVESMTEFMYTAFPQAQLGHSLTLMLCWLYFRQRRRSKEERRAGSCSQRADMRWQFVRQQQPSSWQSGNSSQTLRSLRLIPMWIRQHSLQKLCPQGLLSSSLSVRQTAHSPTENPGF